MVLFSGIEQSIKTETSNDDNEEEKNSLDEEKILERLEACLGELSEDDSYRLKRSYSDLWHRLFTTYNKGKNQDEKMVGPVGILEEYCRLYENHFELQEIIDSPLVFNNRFVDVSLRVKLNLLAKYYKGCQKTLREVHIGVEEKTLNNNDVYKKINDNFYGVPREWLLV